MWYEAEMLHPTTHKFLLWLGPSILIFMGTSIGLLAALAQTYAGIKKWGEDWFFYLVPIMTAPWFLVLALATLIASLGALVYCARPVPPTPLDADAEYERRSIERKVEVRLKQDQARETDAAIIGWWNWFVAERNRQIEARKKDE